MKLDFNMFDSLLEPCVILNRRHEVVYCNETAGLLFGISVRKIIRLKMKLESLLEFERNIAGLKNLETVSAATPVEEVGVKSTTSGAICKLQISIQPFEAGDSEKLWILFIRDVTLEERLQRKYKGELEQKETIIEDLRESKKIIEDYSLNLEKKVNERTQELNELNQTLTALLDSLSQGFFIFDKTGVCLSVYSKACESILEGKPVGKHFSEVLSQKAEEKAKIHEWVEFLFEQNLPFDESILFGPHSRHHSEGKNIELAYCPIFDVNEKLLSVVVVASDTTSLVEAQREAEFEKNQAKLILNILKNRKQIHNFLEECKKIIKKLNTELAKSEEYRDQSEIFRGLHTLKGGSASIGIVKLSEHCHLAENVLSDIKLYKPHSFEASEKWRKFEGLMQEIGKDFFCFLEETAQLIGKSLSGEKILEISFSKFIKTINQSEPVVISDEVRELLVEEFVMEPVFELVKGYQGTLEKLSQELGKLLLPLEIQNGYIKVLSDNYKNLFNSLVHVFRNAIDHGIESPEKRKKLGKSAAGKITIEFEKNEQNLKIVIKDDGGGIDPNGIRAKLLKNGNVNAHESDEQIIQHIFDAGFSTKQDVTAISGRGVGMDAVMYAAVEMGGRAHVFSQLNHGTVFTIEVPYAKKMNNNFYSSARKIAN